MKVYKTGEERQMPKYINKERVRGKCSFCNRRTNCFERRGSHWNCWELDESFAADVVEVKHGVWQTDFGIAFTCSVCNRMTSKPYDFCPNCGADMRGETK